MKNVTYLLLILCVSFVSCDKIGDKLTIFDIDYTSTVDIPATTLVNIPIAFDTPAIETNSNTTFKNNNTAANLIESIKLKSLNLFIESPEAGNFNFLKEITVFIDAEGLDRVEVATIKDLADNNVRSLELKTLDVELKEYLKKDSYNLRISASTDQTINEKHTINIKSVFKVDANIFGL